MPTNFSKIILNGETLMDVTGDTVDSDNLLSGETATKNSGTKVTGSVTIPVTDVTQNGTSVLDGTVAKVTVPELGKTIPYGECSTAEATVAKTVTITGVTALTAGLMIAVKFTNTNTATAPTLQVNSLAAAAIKRYGTTAVSTSAATSWNAGSVVTLLYDGTNWQLVDFNNTTYSAMSESEMQTGTATTARNITAARLKQAVEYHAPVTSVNGSTGAVTVTVPTKVTDLTNDAGYISSYTETDPVFSASAAAGISSSDITNWNGKTSNTGTVTSVAVSNATNGGLSISGSPVTTSGTVTVGHSNVLTSAQTTQAVYPVKIDKNGHISAYGTAVTSMPASDVSDWAKASTKPSYTASEVGAVPTTRKVNGKALSADITLSASDVSALPSSTTIPSKTSDLTNDSGFITGYTETDPVFSASAAAGITSTDITNWNAAEANVQANWNETSSSSDAYIQNKPTNVSAFTNDASYATTTEVSALKVLVISVASFSSLPQTVNDSAITANHVCIKAELGTPSAQTGDWTVTTSAGSLTITGSISGSTTAKLYLAVQA